MYLGSSLSLAFSLAVGTLVPSHSTFAQTGRPEERDRAAVSDDVGVRRPLELEGTVFGPDGNPVEGAVVVSSAGGKAVTDASGSYRITVEVPDEAASVQVTAVGGTSGSLVASQQVEVHAAPGSVWAGALVLAHGSTCSPSWLPTFGGEPGMNGLVRALTVFDDGSGPALYAGGGFTSSGGAATNGIAKWDGSRWTALGSGMSITSVFGAPGVHAMTVFDDGGGPALYAAGRFLEVGGVPATRIAKWNGSIWSALGSGLSGGSGFVHALTVFDDGGGPALYAAGNFTSAGGVPVNRIAKWNGSSWTGLGSGVSSSVYALTVFDDGGGPALYAGGEFTTAGGVSASKIAKWNGSSWSALGNGVSSFVSVLTGFDDGSGPALYAGGGFGIARWNGSAWTGLGGGLPSLAGVSTLAVLDDGSGAALYAGGTLLEAGGVVTNRVARWNGSSWSAFGSEMDDSVLALTVFDDGGGPALHAGGAFTVAGGVLASRIAKWDGASWAARGGNGLDSHVFALTVFDDGGGAALYAGGAFTNMGGVAANRIAKWDGSSWTPLGSGMNNWIRALTVFDDGGGPALYAAGLFTSAGGVAATRIAKWDGSSWSPLGSGMNNEVRALTVFDDGSGPALYAGGSFASAGGVTVNKIARWNGSSWTALGSGFSLGTGVYALTVFDNGLGPALYAGGDFAMVGGVMASNIAKWNGSSWAPLGSGTNSIVYALTAFDDGGVPALYAGGTFTTAGGVAASQIARWSARWTPLGSGMSGINSQVRALTTFDDGTGAAVYAAGQFTVAGGVVVNRIAKWDGSSWAPLGSGSSISLEVPGAALAGFDDGSGPALYAGGSWGSFIDSGDSYLGKWGCDSTPPTLSCPSAVTVRDSLRGSPGEFVTFTVTATDTHDPSPDIVCTPPSGSFFPRGTTIVHCTATDDEGNESSCQFPVHVGYKAATR